MHMRFAPALLLITLPKAKASSVPSLEQLTARVGVLERELVEAREAAASLAALPKLAARVAVLEKVHLSNGSNITNPTLAQTPTLTLTP